jgi:hypothetical protein
MTTRERAAIKAYAEVRRQMAQEQGAPEAEARGIGWLAWLGMAAAVVLAVANYASGLAI